MSTYGKWSLDSERSREARAVAEAALVWLLHALGDEDLPLIILGGLVPDFLTFPPGPTVPPHLGTIDVDILINLQVAPDRDLSPLERALAAMSFAPVVETPPGWRWRGSVEGGLATVEFLCDLEDHPDQVTVAPAGCARLRILNLRGTGYVAQDWTWLQLRGVLPDGRPAARRVRIAALSGYLLSKVGALRGRGKAKDYYDFVYVLQYNREGGPREAADALLKGSLAKEVFRLGSTWREVESRFQGPNDVGPRSYATEARTVMLEQDPSVLRQDAVAAVAEFLSALGVATR